MACGGITRLQWVVARAGFVLAPANHPLVRELTLSKNASPVPHSSLAPYHLEIKDFAPPLPSPPFQGSCGEASSAPSSSSSPRRLVGPPLLGRLRACKRLAHVLTSISALFVPASPSVSIDGRGNAGEGEKRRVRVDPYRLHVASPVENRHLTSRPSVCGALPHISLRRLRRTRDHEERDTTRTRTVSVFGLVAASVSRRPPSPAP
ncbi:hypothetical protein C8R45DRAFT_198417 [Mycena sanguinolenta]|nr:hypothetical protein C8R45DRAFT_198417 [Mycena sanguinolenta]